ncbi:MAG TPA: AAA family ATPase, partial [Sporichthya sp.]|nr:AAA family ATPase [Sporichthya sp.]
QIISGLFEAGAEAVRRFGGTVDKFTGDGVMAVFGAPVAQEDHATRAAHAALALVSSARDYAAKIHAEHGIDLQVRVGLNSGEVVAGDVGASGFTAVGHTVGLAQRMESLSEPGRVTLSEHTAALVTGAFELRDLGRVGVKGAVAPVGTFELAAPAAHSPGRRRAGSARLIGRDAELATLEAALTNAQEGRAQVIGIVGEAGAGKSRLCEELARRAGERGVIVRRAAGVAHATSVSLLPILQWFRDYFAITDADSPAQIRERVGARVLALDPQLEAELGVLFDFLEVPDPTEPRSQLSPEVRRRQVVDLIRRITARRSELHTLLLVLEDLHWFDPQSVEFLDAWLPSFPGSRTLIVTNFRPEFQAPWSRFSYYRQIPLVPLDVAAVDELLGELLGSDASLTPLAGQLRERTGGNPFFTEEIVRSLAGDGTLIGSPGAYRMGRASGELRVPPTVQAVLAGRIDRLSWREKSVLQSAAVIGRTFAEPILATVTGLEPSELADALRTLCVEELLQQAPDPGEYRFWHPLTQEVAYGTLLTATRRRHHLRVAQALIDSSPGRHDHLAALIATHFEAAGEDAEAARWQIRAGNYSLRTDVAEAQRRWRAAIAHLDAVPDAPDALELGVRARSRLLRFGARIGTDAATAARLLAEAQAAADRLGKPSVSIDLAISAGSAWLWTGDARGAIASYTEAADQAQQAGDVALSALARAGAALAAPYAGPLHPGLAHIAEIFRLCGGDPQMGTERNGFSVYDAIHTIQAYLDALAGSLDEARRLNDVALSLYGQRPTAEWSSWALSLVAPVADWTGDPALVDEAGRAAERARNVADDSGNVAAGVRALQASGIAALLAGHPADAVDAFTEGLARARKHRSGLFEEGNLLAHLARGLLARTDVVAARAAGTEAVAVARRQRAAVVECFAHLIRARIWRETSAGPSDIEVARESLTAGERLAVDVGADTYAAFLAEERARLDGGDLTAVAAGYETIGATGHAARIRAEVAG